MLQINILSLCSGLSAEAKRKVEAQLAALEEELEEERTQAELASDRARRLQMQVDQLTNELNGERSNSQKLENTKMALERQVSDTRIIVYFFSN